MNWHQQHIFNLMSLKPVGTVTVTERNGTIDVHSIDLLSISYLIKEISESVCSLQCKVVVNVPYVLWNSKWFTEIQFLIKLLPYMWACLWQISSLLPLLTNVMVVNKLQNDDHKMHLCSLFITYACPWYHPPAFTLLVSDWLESHLLCFDAQRVPLVTFWFCHQVLGIWNIQSWSSVETWMLKHYWVHHWGVGGDQNAMISPIFVGRHSAFEMRIFLHIISGI